MYVDYTVWRIDFEISGMKGFEFGAIWSPGKMNLSPGRVLEKGYINLDTMMTFFPGSTRNSGRPRWTG